MLSFAAAGTPPGLDAAAAGQVLCVHTADGSAAPGDAGRRDGAPPRPDCCLAGCVLCGGLAPLAAAAAFAPPIVRAVVAETRPEDVPHGPWPERFPQRSRAPPPVG